MERYKAVLIAIGTVAGVAALIVFGLADLVHVKSGLSLQEQQLVGYQHQETALNERKAAVFDGLKGPITVSGPVEATGSGYPQESLADVAPQGKDEKGPGRGKSPGLSLVVIKDRSKMAIINGEVVKEGDRTKNGRVMRITKNGVLMKSTEGERWVNIE